MASRLRIIREAAGIAQWALADQCGISAGYLAKFESGERTPTAQLAEKIAGVLGVDVEIIFPGLSVKKGVDHARARA